MLKKIVSLLTISFLFSFTAALANNNNDDVQIIITEDGAQAQLANGQTYNFGELAVGQIRSVTYTVTNTTKAPVEFGKAYIAGVSFNGYTNCVGVLAPEKNCAIQIDFSPLTPGFQTGHFDLYYNKTMTISLDLMGHAF